VFPNVPVIRVENGDLRILDVKNASDMDHPFHLHGFFFQVPAKNGVPQPLESTGNKDTIIVPGKTSMSLVSRFDEPGHWMYHCHILEHAEGGMMGEIHVE
jgi:FtsP/CotA-like multicopper oxidase with cupredoxin domain